MIQALLGKKVLAFILKQVMKAISKKWDLDKMRSYVEDENELDLQMRATRKTLGRCGASLEEAEKDIAILKKDSHPPIFSLKDIDKINKRLKWLEKKIK